jgi:predicted glycosyltransferase
VYSIFRGKIGAVDHYLEKNGRLVLLTDVADVNTKIAVQRRDRNRREFSTNTSTLCSISEAIISIAEHQCLPSRP